MPSPGKGSGSWSFMLQKALTMFIGAVGLVWYFVCLLVIGNRWSVDPGNATFRDFMSLSITTIGVALATFVGLILGFKVVSGQVKGVDQAHPGLEKVVKTTEITDVQWIVAILYILSLPIALYSWWLKGDDTDQAIVNLAKSLLGLVGGALSVLLNLPRSRNRTYGL